VARVQSPFGHEPLIALEQWKTSRHRSLWLVVSNWAVSKRDAPTQSRCFYEMIGARMQA